DKPPDAHLKRTASATAARGPQAVDSETEEKLAALGYVGGGGSSGGGHSDGRPRGDPKDKIGLYNLIKQASTASAEGRIDEAIAKAKEALAADPEIVEAYM